MKTKLRLGAAMTALLVTAVTVFGSVATPKQYKMQADRLSNQNIHMIEAPATGAKPINKYEVSHPTPSQEIQTKTAQANKEADKLYTVKVVFEGEDIMPYIAIFNKEYFQESRMGIWYDEMEDPRIYYFKVPAGTYDIYLNYWNSSEDSEWNGWGNLIHEDIIVDKDTEETFNSNELVYKFEIRPILRNGEYAEIPFGYDTDEDTFIDDTQANCQLLSHDYCFMKEGCETLSSGMHQADMYYAYEPSGFRDIMLFGKVSDKYHLISTWMMLTNENDLEISFTDFNEINSGEVKTFAEGFIKYPIPDCKHTPAYSEDLIEHYHSQITRHFWINNVMAFESDLAMPAENPNVYLSIGPSKSEFLNLQGAISFTIFDIDKTIVFEGEDYSFSEPYRSGIHSLPALLNGDKWEYVNQNHSSCGNYSYQIPEENGPIYEYPGVSSYSFFNDEISQPFGNSSPILVHMTQVNSYDDNIVIKGYQPQAYIGRFGEIRMIDYDKLLAEVYLNGDKVLESSSSDLEQWCVENSLNGHEPGNLELVYTNRNVRVDDLDGFNITKMKVDERNEDVCPPTTQMLIFKNTDGKIIDRFKSADEGVMEFSAGDFNWHDTGERHFFTCEPIDVKVEYAPYGSDSFYELEVEEIPENYYMPGFGYFYRGSLGQISVPSDNGWYDLRFTLVDEAGNSMEQHISPAFKIDDLTSVKSAISGDSVAFRAEDGFVKAIGQDIVSIELYSTDGRKIASACGSQVTARANGIVIVRATDASGKTSISKLNIR